jgi:hypothetical protein
LGLSFKASQPTTLGPRGFGGELIRDQPMMDWRKTKTPCDVTLIVSVHK